MWECGDREDTNMEPKSRIELTVRSSILPTSGERYRTRFSNIIIKIVLFILFQKIVLPHLKNILYILYSKMGKFIENNYLKSIEFISLSL